ncbi:Fur-regulated basic protein FbpA [Mesobacillus subterraneus]|uniref:Fur-regulated basic protein FbpA n=1 Tax=Mesobacillus subterraneus TaxID=285983 RepID=A0A3R9E851_9BACI|nr:Fur-regulated basic protein FbpA [Mesobacillus subterraneus]
MAMRQSSCCAMFKMNFNKEALPMSIFLRSAIDKLKEHYIQHLLNSGMTNMSETELKKMTVTELKDLLNREIKCTKN